MTDASVTTDQADERRLEPRTRRAPEEREAQILDAAFHAFAADGLDETRLDDIARRAGVAKGTIYLYFPNKEALFREMIRRLVIVKLEEIEQAPRDPDPLADFHRLVRTFWVYLNGPQFPVVYRLVNSAMLRLPELSQFFIERVALRRQRLMQSSIDACVTAGVFAADQQGDAARMLNALLMQHALMRANPSACGAMHLDDGDVVLERILAFFIAAMRPAALSLAHTDARAS